MSRPSGVSGILDGEDEPIIEEPAHFEERGRFNFFPRWRKQVDWLVPSITRSVEALIVFEEPGLLSIREWAKDGPAIQQRFKDLAASQDEGRLRAMRWIQTRYRRLKLPPRERPCLGDAALVHLGFPTEKTDKLAVYVWLLPDRLEIASPEYRGRLLSHRNSLTEDLP